MKKQANAEKNSTNSPNSKANFWVNLATNLKTLFTLPKWLKIFLIVLSIVAVAGVIGSFALINFADDKIETANLTFNGIDKGNKEVKANENAYSARVHFKEFDFLLRSKTISYVDVIDVVWSSEIKSEAITSLKSQNRYLKFITSQNLSNLNNENLGEMSFKMDFSPLLKTIIKYYVLIALLCLFANFLYRLIYLAENGKFSLSLNQNSIPQVLYQGYKNINPLYRHTFWIVFIITNLVFGFHTVQFLWGNHDWDLVFGQIYHSWFMVMGRYTHDAISLVLQMGMLLPFFNNILAFIGLALSAVWICIYLNIERKVWIWSIIGLLLALSPLTFERLYFTHQVAGFFIALAFCTLGFVLAKKASEYDKSQKNKSYVFCILSILSLHWALATYQPFIDTIFILLCGGLICIIVDEKGDIKKSIYKARFIFISTFLAIFSYKIVFNILKTIDIVKEGYNNSLAGLSGILSKIEAGFKLAFSNLFTYDSISMPFSMTFLFMLFLVILIALYGLLNFKLKTKLVIIILFVLSIISSQTHNILSANIVTRTDINSTGLLMLRILILALTFKFCFELVRAKKLIHNLLFLISVFIIWLCVIINLNAQRIQKQAFDAEINFYYRFIDRLEQNENFSYNKKYCGIMFNNVEYMRLRYSNKQANQYDILENYTMTQGLLADDWNAGYIFKWLMPQNIFSECDFYLFSNESNKKNEKFKYLINRLQKAGILDTLEPFPHKNSVVVFEDIIVFVANRGNLDSIKQMIKTDKDKE